jgi:hypothetical protein
MTVIRKSTKKAAKPAKTAASKPKVQPKATKQPLQITNPAPLYVAFYDAASNVLARDSVSTATFTVVNGKISLSMPIKVAVAKSGKADNVRLEGKDKVLVAKGTVGLAGSGSNFEFDTLDFKKATGIYIEGTLSWFMDVEFQNNGVPTPTPTPDPTPAPTDPVAVNPNGYLDGATATEVHGWVLDVADYTKRLRVLVLADGKQIASGIADQFRQDIKDSVGGDGKAGFNIKLPAMDKGIRKVTAAVQTATGVFELKNGPREVTVS